MSPFEPVDPRVRLAITQWPPDAPRGSVSTFCAEHGISRKTFYAIKKRAEVEGQAAALEPRTRRPRLSPNRTADAVKAQAIGVRAALEQSGLDHGPISVHEKMKALGMTPVPSTAALSRIFRDAGVARVEPRKKPRASFRRFVYPAPNACWQLDGTEYVLTAGRKCVIFQLIDDHSRLAVASHVAWGETSKGAIAVVAKGITAHGVPQRLLTDNGAALNPSRRGAVGQLVTYVTALGVEAITGKPYKPTTQGRNERFHQTLFRFLDKQPLAASLEQLQGQVDLFDQVYNTERPHQGLPGRITPLQAWEATPKADPPRPRNQQRPVGWDGIRRTTVAANGIVQVRQTRFHVTRLLAGQSVYLVETDQHLLVFDDQGTQVMKYRWPRPGIKYVGSGRPRGRQPRTL
ncbi:winged helix-turn helix protein [Rhodoglobus vestalii]|uniref:Winged helix-turn helix protein n=1 Tax=Rhodoglobus vestalii TaxID=193384 RepID=A0A8H2K865_9MICO|nr:winged helix-turn helix protein [Rhodoglobus vestalii]